MTLSPDDFDAFFFEIHGHGPFPWQRRLMRRIADTARWPQVLDLPTGSGKTATIDVALFHLALDADSSSARRAPVRIAFVVDRRLVVDDAFERARRIAEALGNPPGPITARVAERLRRLSLDGPPLLARRLRGGIPREDDWARTPSQPIVLCSTVDQIGSRLLFRGYGVSDSMKPVHAGLIGSDCLILLDEAHLAEPFRQTLGRVHRYRGPQWREVDNGAPVGFALLTATARRALGEPLAPDDEDTLFTLDDEDRADPILRRRLDAAKPARLVSPVKTVAAAGDDDSDNVEDDDRDGQDTFRRVNAIVSEVQRALRHFEQAENGAPHPAIAIVVNRVARARMVFGRLRAEFKEAEDSMAEPVLLIGPARPLDRDDLAAALAPIRTRTWKVGERRMLSTPMLIVATQCIEAGVDIDLDALVTEAAPLDALRQRFGRLNRAGREVAAFAAIVASGSDLSSRHDDPVYGKTIKPAWEYLLSASDRREAGVPIVDLGLDAFAARMEQVPLPVAAVSEKIDAPVLLPAHLDLLAQTSPIPLADPDTALFLHGPTRQPDAVTVVWRADVRVGFPRRDEMVRLLLLVPPRTTEGIQLPVWAVRRWLTADRAALRSLADVPTAEPEDEQRRPRIRRSSPAFRWKGDDPRSQWTTTVVPGDTIVVPATYGGADQFGWNPGFMYAVTDIASRAAAPFAGRRLAVRVAPGLVGDQIPEDVVANALAGSVSRRWRDIRAALDDLSLPGPLREDIDSLDDARHGRVDVYLDLYGTDDQGRPRGVVFVAPYGIRRVVQPDAPNSTEDDVIGSIRGFSLRLDLHTDDVTRKAEKFARAVGLNDARVIDICIAARSHDAGKADPRFQSWLASGDPLGPDPAHLLAKSGRRLPSAARDASGLPAHWRHEALSVRMTARSDVLDGADDPELVLWLIGTHHGHGRPWFPHSDETECAPDVGPQSLAFDWRGADWATLFERLKARYGAWELARLEAILRLADHRASEEETQDEVAQERTR